MYRTRLLLAIGLAFTLQAHTGVRSFAQERTFETRTVDRGSEPYEEIEAGTLEPGAHTWEAPYRSDWALAIGEFAE